LIGSALRPSLGAGVGPCRGRSVATSEILGPASAHRRPEWKRTRKGLLNPTQRASFPRSNVSRQSEGRATIPESRQGGLAGMGRPGLPPESGPPPCGCLRGNPAGSPIRGDLWTMRRSGEPNGTPVSVQRAFRVFLPTHQPGQSRSCPRGGRAARRALRRFPSSRGAISARRRIDVFVYGHAGWVRHPARLRASVQHLGAPSYQRVYRLEEAGAVGAQLLRDKLAWKIRRPCVGRCLGLFVWSGDKSPPVCGNRG